MILRILKSMVGCLCVVASTSVFAQDLLISRTTQDFPEAMSTLQSAIAKKGYKVSRVQRIDEGLKKLGYETDKYRVVFFGNSKEIKDLSNRFPELIPYIPLNFAIFAENGDTLVTTFNPQMLKSYYPAPELSAVFDHWEKDIHDILEEIRAN